MRQTTDRTKGVDGIIDSEPERILAQPAHDGSRLAGCIPTSVWLPLAIFAGTQAFDFVVLLIASKDQPGGYLGAITSWDGQWYERIAVGGYQFPLAGRANPDDTWAWAFLPVFPITVKGFMSLAGIGFATAASLVNLAAGGAAMVAMYKLLEKPGGRFLAASGVALTCTFITAPLFQSAYSEALALLFVCCALLMIRSRRYGWALAAAILLSLTRLITPALTIVVAVHTVGRLRRRREDPLSAAEITWLFALGMSSIGGVWLWSSFVNIRFGPGTGASARTQKLANHPVLGWFSGLQDLVGWPGPTFLVMASIALVLCAVAARLTGLWGLEVRTWLWAYPILILATTPVTTGVLRYLLLAFPLPLLVVAGRPPQGFPWAKTGLVLATCLIGLLLQIFWISHSLVFPSGTGSVYFMP